MVSFKEKKDIKEVPEPVVKVVNIIMKDILLNTLIECNVNFFNDDLTTLPRYVRTLFMTNLIDTIVKISNNEIIIHQNWLSDDILTPYPDICTVMVDRMVFKGLVNRAELSKPTTIPEEGLKRCLVLCKNILAEKFVKKDINPETVVPVNSSVLREVLNVVEAKDDLMHMAEENKATKKRDMDKEEKRKEHDRIVKEARESFTRSSNNESCEEETSLLTYVAWGFGIGFIGTGLYLGYKYMTEDEI